MIKSINPVVQSNIYFKTSHKQEHSVKQKQNFTAVNPFEQYHNNLATVNFASKNIYKKIRCCAKDLTPIASKEEYDEVIKRVCSSKTINGVSFWEIESDYNRYPDIDKELIGLLPYCGGNDVSYNINSFLSNRLTTKNEYTPTKDSIVDIVRALDYSLNYLDKNFGQYEGIVFRKGVFGNDSGQFYSTSMSCGIAAHFNGFSKKSQYSVIKTKTGHKIYDFQKSMNNSFAPEEKEILISRTAKHREIFPDDCSSDLQKARLRFAREIVFLSEKDALYFCHPKQNLSFEDALNKIRLFEEI